MAKQPKRGSPEAADDHGDDAKERVRWLLQHHWSGNRSSMAKQIGMSVTGLVNVVAGAQEPGRRLLTAIVENSDVNPSWLLTGRGGPFLSSALPVARQPLPGSPVDHAGLLTAERIGAFGDQYRETRYWLRLRGGEPVLRRRERGLLKGDLLLVETARATFPPAGDMDGRLCVVRVPGTPLDEYRLAEMGCESRDDGRVPERLGADTFDLGNEVVEQVVVENLLGGDLRAYRRRVVRKKIGTRGFVQSAPLRDGDSDHYEVRVTPDDVVGVCVMAVRLWDDLRVVSGESRDSM